MALQSVLIFLSLLLWGLPVLAQKTEHSDSLTHHKTIIDTDDHNWRVQQEKLEGVYIPADLQECFIELDRLIEPEGKRKFKAMNESDAARKLHFSLGKWIMRNWSLYRGSRLSKHLNDLGLYHPDDMVQFIIVTYHRLLNDKPLEVKERIEEYQLRRNEEYQQRLLEGTLLEEWSEQKDSTER